MKLLCRCAAVPAHEAYITYETICFFVVVFLWGGGGVGEGWDGGTTQSVFHL